MIFSRVFIWIFGGRNTRELKEIEVRNEGVCCSFYRIFFEVHRVLLTLLHSASPTCRFPVVPGHPFRSCVHGATHLVPSQNLNNS